MFLRSFPLTRPNNRNQKKNVWHCDSLDCDLAAIFTRFHCHPLPWKFDGCNSERNEEYYRSVTHLHCHEKQLKTATKRTQNLYFLKLIYWDQVPESGKTYCIQKKSRMWLTGIPLFCRLREDQIATWRFLSWWLGIHLRSGPHSWDPAPKPCQSSQNQLCRHRG